MQNTGSGRSVKTLYLGALAALTLIIQLSGCIQPLDEAMVTVAKDEFAPTILLIPPEGNVYRSTLLVTGTVEDFVDREGIKSGEIEEGSLKWGILNKAADKYNGSFTLDGKNNFTITVDTSDLSEIIVLKVSAEDLSGNTGTEEVTLEPYLQGPYVIITSPQDNEEWANELEKTVTGSVRNSPTDTGITEVDFDTLSVYVTQTENSDANPGNLIVNEQDGTFTFGFATEGLAARQAITVSVSDKNGVSYQKIIYIVSISEGPYIEIASPANRSFFGTLVEVTGSVRATSEVDSGTAGITRLKVSLAGDATSNCTYNLNTATGEWTPSIADGFALTWNCGIGAGAEDGDFFFSFSTEGRENDQLIEVLAENINRRQTITTLTLLDDNQGPYIEIYSPEEMSYYYNEISISGIVTDADAVAPFDATDVDDVGSVTWEILGEAEGGALSIASDASFAVSGIDSNGYTGNKTIRITAADKNNNTSVAYRTLLEHTDGPAISIENPACYPYYDHTFTLNGTVSHDGGIDQVDQTVGNLQWQFTGDVSWTNFVIDGPGNFSIASIDTTGRTGTQIIRVRALDLNGDLGLSELLLLNDNTGVDMTVVSPSSGSYYASAVPVEVIISDYVDLAAADYLTWELIGQGVNGLFTENEGGNYTAVIDTGSYTSDLSLRIVATDVHGNTTQEVISLLYGESTIPTFSVESANSSVVATWDAVPLPASYNVYYTTDGSTPVLGLGSYPSGGTYMASGVMSGQSITGLQNGDQHVFILEAELSGGYDPSVSGEVIAVPLSPLSYCPSLRQEVPGSVILEWPDYGGDTGYTVWRSVDKGNIWQKISGQLAVNSFTDTGVTDGDLAWYKIKPVRYSNVESYYAAIKVHYLDTAAEFSTADNTIQALKADMVVFEYAGNTYLASLTAVTGSLGRKIEIHNITEPKNIPAAARRTLSDAIELDRQPFITAAENLLFMVSTDDGSGDGHQLVVYSFDPASGTITLEHELCLAGISYGSTVMSTDIDGICAWFGDEGDADAVPEYWVFINNQYIADDKKSGMFVIKVVPGVSSTVVNLVETATNGYGFADKPHIYSEDDGGGLIEKLSIYNNETYSIETLVDFPSLDLAAVTLLNFDSYAMGGGLTDIQHTATDTDSFFVVDSNTIYAFDESDESRYASYTLLQEPNFIECTNGFLIAAGDSQYLTSFNISDIDYVAHTMELDRQWRKLYSQGACSDGVAFVSTIWQSTIDVINIGAPALAITPHNSVIGSALDELELKQNLLYGDVLYTYNAGAGNVLRWSLQDLQSMSPPAPTDDVNVTILLGGLFAAGDYCYGVRNSIFQLDFATDTAAEIQYQIHPYAGTIWAQGQYQTAERYGHYLFTAGKVEDGSPRVLGTYDIGPLASYELELLCYNYEATGGWENLLRTGNYVIALQTDSEELIITDVTDWTNIETVNRIDTPDAASFIQNQFTFLPYGGRVFFNYYDSGYLYLSALDIDRLETASWEDLVEIDRIEIAPIFAGYVTTALSASGDYLFTAYSSCDSGGTDGICGIRSYRLADSAELIRLDGVYTYTNGIEVGNPISGLRTDGEYLYLIRGDSFYLSNYSGGIEVFSIDENF